MNYNYYKAHEIRDNQYYQLPKALFQNPNYSGLSLNAKVVYAFLLDRLPLSQENEWVDENGNVFIIYTRQAIMEELEISKPTASKCFNQLNEFKLIHEVRQGLSKPNLIYVCRIETQAGSQVGEGFTSRGKKTLPQEVKKVNSIQTNSNKTDKTKTISKEIGAEPNVKQSQLFSTKPSKAKQIEMMQAELDGLNKNKFRKKCAELRVGLAELTGNWQAVTARDFAYYFAKVLYPTHYGKQMVDFDNYFTGSIKSFLETYGISKEKTVRVFNKMMQLYDLKYKSEKFPTVSALLFKQKWILDKFVPNLLADIRREDRRATQAEKPAAAPVENKNKNVPDYF